MVRIRVSVVEHFEDTRLHLDLARFCACGHARINSESSCEGLFGIGGGLRNGMNSALSAHPPVRFPTVTNKGKYTC